MRKLFSVLLWISLIIASTEVYCQIAKQPIKLTKDSYLKRNYYDNNTKSINQKYIRWYGYTIGNYPNVITMDLKGDNLEKEISSSTEAVKELNKFRICHKTSKIINTVSFFGGFAIIIGGSISASRQKAKSNNPADNKSSFNNATVFTGAGVVLAGQFILYGFRISEKKHLYKSVDIYNKSIGSPSSDRSRWTPTQAGLSLFTCNGKPIVGLGIRVSLIN